MIKKSAGNSDQLIRQDTSDETSNVQGSVGRSSGQSRVRSIIEIQIPARTYIGIFVAILAALALVQLRSLLMLFSFAALLAVTMIPIRDYLARHFSLRISTTLVIVLLISVISVLFGLLLPATLNQLSVVLQDAPKYKEQILRSIPQDHFVYVPISHILDSPMGSSGEKWMERLTAYGGMAVEGLSTLVLFLVLSIYLMIGGASTFAWLSAFFHAGTRQKLKKTGVEVRKVVASYVIGQFITSVLLSLFAFVVLKSLKVPAALLLSVLAGLFDILPIVGLFLSTVPALLFALQVSPSTAWIVLAAYLFYHVIETYVLVPFIYGNRMKLSALAVLLSLVAGALLGGIPGAILSLPVAASYSIIERIWLSQYLGASVIQKHASTVES